MSTRAQARQNLLVASINTALDRGLISLECEPFESATFEYNIGPYPVIAHVNDAGFEEVAIKAIVNPTKLGREYTSCAVYNEFRRFGEATTYGWLERRTGKYLQSSVDYHGTKEVTEYLGGRTITPHGFGTKPTSGGYDFHKEFESVFGPSIGRVQPIEPIDDVLPVTFDNLRAKFEPIGLCSNGFTDDTTKCTAGWDMRSDLKEHLVKEVERAVEWLKLCEQTEKVDRHQTSYGLKHEAERWCRAQGHANGYVSNGALLMAACILGFKVYRPVKELNFPNGFLNISRHRPQAKADR